MAFISLLASIGYCEIFIAIFCFFVLALQGRSSFIWNWPFLGMFPTLVLHIHRIHEKSVEVLSRTRGTFLIKGLWFTNMDILGTVDPANVHYIMSANFTNFPKGQELRKIFDVLGDGIFCSDMDVWKNQRKLARALINHERFHKCSTKISLDKVKNGLIPILELIAKEDRTVDLQDVFKRFTFDTTCKLLTGFESCCLSLDQFPEVPFLKAMDDAKYAISIRYLLPESVWKLQKWIGVGPEMKLRKAWDVLDRVISKYILMKREELSRVEKCKENKEGFDLLTPYIINDGETTSGLKFDNKFLRDTFLNYMFAGHDTVSSGLTWFIWLVSTHPEVEKNIRKELRAIIPKEEAEKWRLFTAVELKNAVYLHATLCESLRLYPPVAFQHKTPLEPDILPSGHHVHPNMRVMIPLYAMGRMESIWGKDALEFKPHRWISDRGTIKHEPSYKFFSFNAGPRTCLGKEVAFTQMKLVVATIIYNYQIEMVKGHVVCPNVSVMLYMKHGFKVRVKRKWA